MTDDQMNDQPNDAIQDERIRSLAAGHYNAPDGSVRASPGCHGTSPTPPRFS